VSSDLSDVTAELYSRLLIRPLAFISVLILQTSVTQLTVRNVLWIITDTQTHNRLTALWILSKATRVSRTRTKVHPLTPIVVISNPVFASSVYYDPWPPPCSIHVPDSLHPQSLSKLSLVGLFTWHPQLHTKYISSPNHCLPFAAHAHTITTCFAMSSNPSLSLNPLLGSPSCSLMPHIHLTILISAH